MILTATNERVQMYLHNNFVPPTTTQKKSRFKLFTQLVERGYQFLDELFPSKQQQVLDEILFLTSGVGIAKIGAEHLAKRAGVSVRTVSTLVKKLKESDQYLVARLSNSRAGKYIFVDKLHPNFSDIMATVFMQDASQFASQFASLESSVNVDVTASNTEKTSPNCINSINLKQEKYINNKQIEIEQVSEDNFDSYEQNEKNAVTDFENQKQILEQYATTEMQHTVFDMLFPFVTSSALRNDLYKIALRIGRDNDAKAFHLAKDIVLRINHKLSNGLVLKESVVAMFEYMYREAKVNASRVFYNYDQKQNTEASPKAPVRKVFYNWLLERE